MQTGTMVRESESPSPPMTAATAIDAFQSQALAAMPTDLTPEVQAFAVNAINDQEHLHARRLSCQACFRRIDGTLTQAERESLILFGAINDLRDQPGDCWEIMSFGGFGNSIEGYLDANTGKLLVLWIVPEG